MYDGELQLKFARVFRLRVSYHDPQARLRVGWLQIFWCQETDELLVKARVYNNNGDEEARASELRRYDSDSEAILSIPSWHDRFQCWMRDVPLEDPPHDSRLPHVVPQSEQSRAEGLGR
jgi:hypothetical protein